MRGFTQVQMIAAAVVLGLLVALALVLRSYINSVDQRGYERGVMETTVRWEQRERMNQATYEDEREQLRADHDEALGTLQEALHLAVGNYENARREHDHEKARNLVLERDLRAGRVVLNDPGRPANDKACSSEGAAGAAPPPAGVGEIRISRGLSPELSSFLWSEASRADEVVEDLEARLTLAQDTVLAYYNIARDCHAAQ